MKISEYFGTNPQTVFQAGDRLVFARDEGGGDFATAGCQWSAILAAINEAVRGIKRLAPVRVVADADVPDLADVTAIDGVTLADGDRVLLAGQTTASENGVYDFDLGTTTLSRAADLAAAADAASIYVPVNEGTEYADTLWRCTSDTGSAVVGTNDLEFEEFQTGGTSVAHRWMFGDGSDGDVTIDSNTQLTRDMYYDDLTIDGGITLNTNGFDVWVAGTLTVNGTLCALASAGSDSISLTAGAGGAFNGGDSAAGDQITRWRSYAGGAGGDGGTGGTGGSGGSAAGSFGYSVADSSVIYQRLTPTGPINRVTNPGGDYVNYYGGLAGAGGAGGDSTSVSDGGGGGGGGAGGRAVRVFARAIVGSGVIHANGGDGGDGANGGDGSDAVTAMGNGGNGGSAGHGGALLVVSESFGGTVTYSADGGAAGLAGAGGVNSDTGGDGVAGSGGMGGGAGYVVKYNPITGLYS